MTALSSRDERYWSGAYAGQGEHWASRAVEKGSAAMEPVTRFNDAIDRRDLCTVSHHQFNSGRSIGASVADEFCRMSVVIVGRIPRRASITVNQHDADIARSRGRGDIPLSTKGKTCFGRDRNGGTDKSGSEYNPHIGCISTPLWGRP